MPSGNISIIPPLATGCLLLCLCFFFRFWFLVVLSPANRRSARTVSLVLQNYLFNTILFWQTSEFGRDVMFSWYNETFTYLSWDCRWGLADSWSPLLFHSNKPDQAETKQVSHNCFISSLCLENARRTWKCCELGQYQVFKSYWMKKKQGSYNPLKTSYSVNPTKTQKTFFPRPAPAVVFFLFLDGIVYTRNWFTVKITVFKSYMTITTSFFFFRFNCVEP